METPIPNPKILVRVCVRAVTAGKIKGLDQDFRNSSGSFAIFAATARWHADCLVAGMSDEKLKLDAMPSATITSVRTISAVSVWAQTMIGRAMRQMHSGIWQSLTRSRRLIPGGLGDRHPHASVLTGRTESLMRDAWNPIRPSRCPSTASERRRPPAWFTKPVRLAYFQSRQKLRNGLGESSV